MGASGISQTDQLRACARARRRQGGKIRLTTDLYLTSPAGGKFHNVTDFNAEMHGSWGTSIASSTARAPAV